MVGYPGMGGVIHDAKPTARGRINAVKVDQPHAMRSVCPFEQAGGASGRRFFETDRDDAAALASADDANLKGPARESVQEPRTPGLHDEVGQDGVPFFCAAAVCKQIGDLDPVAGREKGAESIGRTCSGFPHAPSVFITITAGWTGAQILQEHATFDLDELRDEQGRVDECVRDVAEKMHEVRSRPPVVPGIAPLQVGFQTTVLGLAPYSDLRCIVVSYALTPFQIARISCAFQKVEERKQPPAPQAWVYRFRGGGTPRCPGA